MILDLSTYLRSTFKNSFKPVSLEEEIRSVNSYIRIQQIGTELPPQLDFEIDADISQASIPPLSILTFVENSIKHSSLIDTPLEIRIKCRKLASEDGGYLNITVSDNSAGFPAEILKTLNGPANEVYNDYHVGIANLKQRLRLLYGKKPLCISGIWPAAPVLNYFFPYMQTFPEVIYNDCSPGRRSNKYFKRSYVRIGLGCFGNYIRQNCRQCHPGQGNTGKGTHRRSFMRYRNAR